MCLNNLVAIDFFNEKNPISKKIVIRSLFWESVRVRKVNKGGE